MGALIEAYKGYYERESIEPWERAESGYTLMGPDAAIDKWVKAKIQADTPKQRLEVYLTWNGIIGYTETVFDIATGAIK